MSDEKKNFLKCDDVSFYYKNSEQKETILNHINLDITPGSIIAILGHNGSGKSTLAKHFNGVLVSKSGELYFNDSKIRDMRIEIKKHIGMVFQNPDNQIVASTVQEDVAFGLQNLGLESEEIRIRIDEALEAVSMKDYANWDTHKLSGGQKQRIAIAGILAMKPECIVLDEPTSMLDPQGRKEVMAVIQQLRKKFGITVILITHFMEEAVECDRVIVMKHGTVLMDDIPSKVFNRDIELKNAGLKIPQSIQLMQLLRSEGIDISLNCLTEAQCIDEIYKLLEV
ncbi:energy-coupling factor transport system ATP-binding protein [Lacrimispora xylanisolvens]|uniref:Energy-coupling factor transport system ATP-binding protein n=1 Tax=Lacrimispora xylanisolvens TaxID=384636 RepID=A0A2S6HN06_9FIRM|nr:energy-coupling factor transporter ATPase [Hungatella xylanolytica]PPK78867.1 energy-coupling factor transport system ATP-binding protein [Hungatella xylanolytica]